MPQDYAYQNEAPDTPGRRKVKQLGKLFFFLILLATVLFVIRYLYMNVDFTRLEEKAIATLPSTEQLTAHVAPPTSKNITKPKFEFYTMLPKGDTVKLQRLKQYTSKAVTTALTQAAPIKPLPEHKMPAPAPQKTLLSHTEMKEAPAPKQVVTHPAPHHIKQKVKIAKAPTHTIDKVTKKMPAPPKTITVAKKKLIQPTKGQFLLQVGSFKTFAEAHKLKGQLLLEGFTVKISTFTNESSTWHRVEVGPYHSLTQAQKAQDTLEDANLNCLLKRIG